MKVEEKNENMMNISQPVRMANVRFFFVLKIDCVAHLAAMFQFIRFNPFGWAAVESRKSYRTIFHMIN